MARKKIVAGNWKMNMTPSQAVKLVEELKPLVQNPDVDVVYSPPAIDIVPVVEAVKGTNVKVGAENMYVEEKGAYTGEIAPDMLVDAGVEYVIIGHSERRDYFKETDAFLNQKVKKAFEHNLTPILCRPRSRQFCRSQLSEMRRQPVRHRCRAVRIALQRCQHLQNRRTGYELPVR